MDFTACTVERKVIRIPVAEILVDIGLNPDEWLEINREDILFVTVEKRNA